MISTSRWKRLYAFGDSYSDTGAGYLDCDGPTAIAYLAEALDIDLVHARAANRGDASINFAVSGARTGAAEGYFARPANAAKGTTEALLARGMIAQAKDYCARAAASDFVVSPEDTVFFIAGGLNDGALNTSTTIENLQRIVAMLLHTGARYLVLAQLPLCIPPFRATAERLNPVLARLISDLSASFPAARFAFSRWGAYFDEVITDPSRFGLTNASEPCAGRALFGEDPTPRGSPDKFFFYHEGHPSTTVHAVVGKALALESRQWFAPSGS